MDSIANQHQQNKTPAWHHAPGVRSYGRYIGYPIAPGSTLWRFKKVQPGQGAKFLWGTVDGPQAGVKPDPVPFYDPTGELARHVADADGVLILAEGESDVWECLKAGIYNVTATMLGAGKFYAYHVDQLQELGVTRILIWPDRDEAGLKHAVKVRDELIGSEISLDVRELPSELGEGGDIGKLAARVGSEHLRAALMRCPRLTLPDPAPPKPLKDLPDLPTEADDLREVERRTRREIARALEPHANGKPGYFYCPFPHKHGKKDFLFNPEPGTKIGGCQGKHDVRRWVDLAEHLSIDVSQIARDVAAERRPVQRPAAPRPEPVDYAALRYFPHGAPEHLIASPYGLGAHLNPWFHVAPRDVPNMGALLALVTAYNAAVLAGTIDPEQGATVNEIATRNPYGLNRAACTNGINHPAAADFFEFCNHYREEVHRGSETHINTRSRGRPSDRVRLRPVGELLGRWLSRLEGWAWRALLITEYPDLPAEALTLEGDLARYGATLDDIAVIDDISQPLYEQHDQALREASKRLASRMRRIRDTIGVDGILAGVYEPLRFPEGTTFSNVARFRDAIDETDPQLRDGERENRYHAADRTGRTLAAHQRSAARRDLLNVPQWSDPAPLDHDLPVLPQIERAHSVALARGRVKLHAPDGTTLRLSSKVAERENPEAWLRVHGGVKGARLSVWTHTIEKRAELVTEAEQEARAEVSEQQRRNQAGPGKADKPTPEPTPVERWLIAQGAMRAARFGLAPMPEAAPQMYISQQSGAVYPLPDVWRGIVQQARLIAAEYGEGEWPPLSVVVEGGEAVATFAAHSEPQERDDLPARAVLPAQPVASEHTIDRAATPTHERPTRPLFTSPRRPRDPLAALYASFDEVQRVMGAVGD